MNFFKKALSSPSSSRNKEDFFKLYEIMPLGVVYHDHEGNIISANPAAQTILGLTMEQLQERAAKDPRWKAVHEDGSDFKREELPSMICLNTGKPVKDVIMGIFNPRENNQKWIRINAYPEFMKDSQKPWRVFATFDDITEMKKTEEVLKEHITRMRKAEQVAGLGNWGFALDEKTIYASEGAREIYGLGGSQWSIGDVKTIPLPEYRPLLDTAIKDLIEENRPYDVRFRIKRPSDGAVMDILSIAEYDQEKRTVFGVIQNITETVRTEKERKESERKISTLLSNLPGIAYRCRNDKNWTMEFISDGCRELTGYDPEDFIENRKLSFNDLIHPDHRERLWEKWQKAIEERKYVQEEYPVILPTGEERWFWEKGCGVYSESGKLIALEGFIADLTDLKNAEKDRIELERKMLQTQKLESLGVLAGGIAHDFNNILMAILGHADLALEELSPMSPARESISEIEKASKRAADLCRQMLAYSGRGRFVVEMIILRDLVDEMVHLLKTSISKKAGLVLNLEKNLPAVKGDATQIRQILMNLVINASDAIGDKEGTITISTGSMNCDRSFFKDSCIAENPEEGHYVWLEVSDTGCGMDKETLSRIFEPFFTTKFTGRGLGMSAVIGIIQGHKGALKIISEPGKGTTFRILLPAEAANIYTQDNNAAASSEKWHGSGTILMVDDEEIIRNLGKAMLSKLGFNVVTAADGREAIDIYKKSGSGIDMVILDLTMPRMNGEETLKELVTIDPEVRVIISSGYTEFEITPKFAKKALAGFIQKPYTMNSLRDCLQSVSRTEKKPELIQ